MVGKYVKGTVELIDPSDCGGENVIFLDAREIEEFETSHIKDAKYVGYDNFSLEAVETIPKNSKIVVYCSIGYRSEKIGEELLELGFTDVYNLNGGIFNWSNNGYPVFNNDSRTKEVHGYSRSWSKWLNTNRVEVVTGKKK